MQTKRHGHTHTTTTYVPNATVKHLPATVSLSSAKLKAGAHTLTVKLGFHPGKAKKSLSAKFNVC